MPSDEQLIQGIADGDRDCLHMLYDRYEPMVFSFVYRVVSDRMAAEEVVQDVFTKVWRAKVTFDPSRAKVSTWLLAITRNVAIDHLRKQRNTAPHLNADEQVLERLPAQEEGPADLAEVNEMRETLSSALSTLPGDQLDSIRKMYFHGMTQQEIANDLNVPVGTIKSRIRLGLGKLRERLSTVGMEGIQ